MDTVLNRFQPDLDPGAVLDFLTACIHIPRLWQVGCNIVMLLQCNVVMLLTDCNIVMLLECNVVMLLTDCKCNVIVSLGS